MSKYQHYNAPSALRLIIERLVIWRKWFVSYRGVNGLQHFCLFLHQLNSSPRWNWKYLRKSLKYSASLSSPRIPYNHWNTFYSYRDNVCIFYIPEHLSSYKCYLYISVLVDWLIDWLVVVSCQLQQYFSYFVAFDISNHMKKSKHLR